MNCWGKGYEIMKTRICECFAYSRKCESEQIKVAMSVAFLICRMPELPFKIKRETLIAMFCVSYSAVTSGEMGFN